MKNAIGKRTLIPAVAVAALGLSYALWARPDRVVLQGTVIRKGWTKTYESWNAGGSEYYVLDVGDVPIQERSAREGVILRPSGSVRLHELARYAGQPVVVGGHFVQAEPYTPPPASLEAIPIGSDGGPAARGSGFRVLSIQVADELLQQTQGR